MKFLNKVIACILCFTLILNLSTVAHGTESVNSPNEIHSYTVKVTSNEYSEPSVTFYEFEGKYYLALDDIKDFTRCTLTEDTETIMLTHGLRELVINKSTGQMVDSGMVDQGNISLLNHNGMYLCEGIPMLQYLGATCSIRNENIEILMPSFTIWESIMPDYLDYYFNINELYGGEDNVKISLILDIIADVLDGVSGHGLMANANMHLEDALYEILNVDMMKYVAVQDAATTLNQKVNDFLSSAAFSTALDTGDNTYDAVYEALDYYVKFYVSGKNDILLDMMTQTDDLEYASDLASQIQRQVYSQSAAKANLKSAKTAQSFMDVGMLAFDTAITSYSMLQYDDDTRNLFARTINQEMFEYADYCDITWNNVSDKISNTLKSTQSIVANTAIENVAEFAVKKVSEEGAKSALSAFTSKANIYAAAAQIGFFIASLINYESNQAFSADMNAIWLSAVQYDIAMLASGLLAKERDEFHFSSAESLENLKNMFTLYYRTTIAFSENIAKSIEEFGTNNDQVWVEWFSSTTENSVANYAAEYLYRITNCTIVPIVDFSVISGDIITYDWILDAHMDDSSIETFESFVDVIVNVQNCINYNSYSASQKEYCRGDFFEMDGHKALLLLYFASSSADRASGYYASIWVENTAGRVSCLSNQHIEETNNPDVAFVRAYIQQIDGQLYLEITYRSVQNNVDRSMDQCYLIGDVLTLKYNWEDEVPCQPIGGGLIQPDESKAVYWFNGIRIDRDEFYSSKNSLKRNLITCIDPYWSEGMPPEGYTLEELLEQLRGNTDSEKKNSTDEKPSDKVGFAGNQTVEQLQKSIVASWGKEGSVVSDYDFNSDGTCYWFFNKQTAGTYQILSDKSLVIAFPWMNDYYVWTDEPYEEWRSHSSEDCWYMTDSGVLILNGVSYYRDGKVIKDYNTSGDLLATIVGTWVLADFMEYRFFVDGTFEENTVVVSHGMLLSRVDLGTGSIEIIDDTHAKLWNLAESFGELSGYTELIYDPETDTLCIGGSDNVYQRAEYSD